MHGLINRSVQRFVCDGSGVAVWHEVVAVAALDFCDFEEMLSYDDSVTVRMLDAVSQVLGRPRADLMEDIGTYLVSNTRYEPLRRLLRFGGVDFEDFLYSLDDLPDRARLAVPTLELPRIELRAEAEGQFSLVCDARITGYGNLLMGVLRVMADDYGALALLDLESRDDRVETVSIMLVQADFAEGRSFELGRHVG